jgi:hypothetical protein
MIVSMLDGFKNLKCAKSRHGVEMETENKSLVQWW